MNELLTKIVVKQRLEWEVRQKRAYIERDILPFARKQLETSLIKVLTGPRRAGKSVLATMMLAGKKTAYLSFDEPAFATSVDHEAIMSALETAYGRFDYVFFDEVQNLPKWEMFVNALHRGGRNIIVTGSNANLLGSDLATHLTGRYVDIEVHPFSFVEFVRARSADGTPMETLAAQYLQSGGYPEVVTSPAVDGPGYLQTLADSVLIKDVLRRHSARKTDEISAILDWCMSNVAKELSYARLASGEAASGLPASHLTAKKYVEYLEEAFLIRQVRRFDAAFRERTRAPRKIYALDTGMAVALGIRQTPDDGRLLENAVYSELLKKGNYRDIRYFKSPRGDQEVDFVLRRGHVTEALLQVCWSIEDDKVLRRELAGLKAAAAATRCNDLTIVTWHDRGERMVGDVRVRVVPFLDWVRG